MFLKTLSPVHILAPLVLLQAHMVFAVDAKAKAVPLTPAPSPLAPLPSTAPSAPIVLGYYSEWSEALPPEKIRYDRFTHLIHAFATVDANGKISSDGANPVPSTKLTALAHQKGVKVLIGIGGGSNGPNFSKMVHDPVKAQTFVRDIVQMAQKNGYDGIDIDWEYPGEGDTDLVTGFITLLRTQLKAANPNALLTMAVSRGNYYGQWFDGPKIKDKLDFLQIMTYDFHGPWSHAGHNAPLYPIKSDKVDGSVSFQTAVDLWVSKGFSKSQLLVGVPCYGRGFAVTAWGQKSTEKSPHEEIKFKDVAGLLQDGWKREWDAEGMVPWLHKPSVDELISYDDEVSARIKGAWARQAGVAGVFYWQIEQDFVIGDNVICNATRAGWDDPATAQNPNG